MDYYNDKQFIFDDNFLNTKIIAPDIYAMVGEKYGFRYKNELQLLNEKMLILPSEVFAGSLEEATNKSHAIHCCVGSWREKPNISLIKKFFDKIKSNNYVRKLFGKKPIITVSDFDL